MTDMRYQSSATRHKKQYPSEILKETKTGRTIFWRPSRGGFVEYVGPRRNFRGLALVLKHDLKDWTDIDRMWLRLATVNSDQVEFDSPLTDVRQIAMLIWRGTRTGECSACGAYCVTPQSTMRCNICRRPFYGVCDSTDGQLGIDVAKERAAWPLKVVPYHVMELSRGKWLILGRELFETDEWD